VIADTHGLLRPEAAVALASSELIIHAGDVGSAEVLDKLREIAPVVAVRGNIDKGPWVVTLPATKLLLW
jgi:putative phosphoesterase